MKTMRVSAATHTSTATSSVSRTQAAGGGGMFSALLNRSSQPGDEVAQAGSRDEGDAGSRRADADSEPHVDAPRDERPRRAEDPSADDAQDAAPPQGDEAMATQSAGQDAASQGEGDADGVDASADGAGTPSEDAAANAPSDLDAGQADDAVEAAPITAADEAAATAPDPAAWATPSEAAAGAVNALVNASGEAAAFTPAAGGSLRPVTQAPHTQAEPSQAGAAAEALALTEGTPKLVDGEGGASTLLADARVRRPAAQRATQAPRDVGPRAPTAPRTLAGTGAPPAGDDAHPQDGGAVSAQLPLGVDAFAGLESPQAADPFADAFRGPGDAAPTGRAHPPTRHAGGARPTAAQLTEASQRLTRAMETTGARVTFSDGPETPWASTLSAANALGLDPFDVDLGFLDSEGSSIDAFQPYPGVAMNRFLRAYPGASLSRTTWGRSFDEATRSSLEALVAEAEAQGDAAQGGELTQVRGGGQPQGEGSRDGKHPPGQHGHAAQAAAPVVADAEEVSAFTTRDVARGLKEGHGHGAKDGPRHARPVDGDPLAFAHLNASPRAEEVHQAEVVQRAAPRVWVQQIQEAVRKSTATLGLDAVRTAVIDVPDERAGRIRMELEMAGGRLTIHLGDMKQEVKAMFESSFSDLQQQLSKQNIDLAGFSSKDKGQQDKHKPTAEGGKGQGIQSTSRAVGISRPDRTSHDGLLDTVA